MTNKIKPFCVDTKEENLTDDQIEQLYQWCLDAGVTKGECLNTWLSEKKMYNYMGIADPSELLCHEHDYYFNNNIIKFKDVPSHLGLSDQEVSDNEESTSVETSVSPSDSFYTKLNTLLTLYPIKLSKGISVTSTDIMITHDNFEHDFIVKCEEEILELIKAFDTLDKLAGK